MDNSIGIFAKNVIEDIRKNLPDDFELADTLNFEVSVISETSKKGTLSVKLVSGDINTKNQLVHRVRFSVHNPKKQTASAINNLQILKHGAEVVVNALKELDSGDSYYPSKKRGKKH